jgi:nitroreductase
MLAGGQTVDVYEAILKRRTVRDFKDMTINQETITRIINAGLHAPSNNHLRQWEFIVMNDDQSRLSVIEKINKNRTARDSEELLDKWGYTDEYQRSMYIDAIPKQYRMLLKAGCLIIPCFVQESPLLRPRDLSGLNAFASIWCCIENILVAATAEGIFGVTRIPSDKEIEHIKIILDIPEKYAVPCYLALGYPDEKHETVIPQHSIQAEERIHFNRWGNKQQ